MANDADIARMLADLGNGYRDVVTAPPENGERQITQIEEQRLRACAQAHRRNAHTLANNAQEAAAIATWNNPETFGADEVAAQMGDRYEGQGHRGRMRTALQDENDAASMSRPFPGRHDPTHPRGARRRLSGHRPDHPAQSRASSPRLFGIQKLKARRRAPSPRLHGTVRHDPRCVADSPMANLPPVLPHTRQAASSESSPSSSTRSRRSQIAPAVHPVRGNRAEPVVAHWHNAFGPTAQHAVPLPSTAPLVSTFPPAAGNAALQASNPVMANQAAMNTISAISSPAAPPPAAYTHLPLLPTSEADSTSTSPRSTATVKTARGRRTEVVADQTAPRVAMASFFELKGRDAKQSIENACDLSLPQMTMDTISSTQELAMAPGLTEKAMEAMYSIQNSLDENQIPIIAHGPVPASARRPSASDIAKYNSKDPRNAMKRIQALADAALPDDAGAEHYGPDDILFLNQARTEIAQQVITHAQDPESEDAIAYFKRNKDRSWLLQHAVQALSGGLIGFEMEPVLREIVNQIGIAQRARQTVPSPHPSPRSTVADSPPQSPGGTAVDSAVSIPSAPVSEARGTLNVSYHTSDGNFAGHRQYKTTASAHVHINVISMDLFDPTVLTGAMENLVTALSGHQSYQS